MIMLKIAIKLVWPFVLLGASFGLYAADKLNLEQAIELALTNDPRIDEKQAFVRKAQGLLQEAKGSEGFRYSVDSYLALTTGLDGGFYEGGDKSCSRLLSSRRRLRL